MEMTRVASWLFGFAGLSGAVVFLARLHSPVGAYLALVSCGAVAVWLAMEERKERKGA
jgi:hypothetical protein